jgi:hypothetical protein
MRLNKMIVQRAVALQGDQPARQSKRKTPHHQKRFLYDQMFRDDTCSEWIQCTIFMSF